MPRNPPRSKARAHASIETTDGIYRRDGGVWRKTATGKPVRGPLVTAYLTSKPDVGLVVLAPETVR